MATTSKSRPSFFIVPDEKIDYKPFVQLGHVIYRVTEPDLLLFPGDEETPPIPLGIKESTKSLEKYKISKDTKHTSKYGLVAKILDFLVDLINVSRGAEKANTESYEVEKMTFRAFSPPKSFLEKLEEQQEIKDYLTNGADARAFLITGIAIAEGIVFKYTNTKNVDKEATIGIKVPQMAEIGPTAKTGDTTGEKVDYEDKGPTLLAFRVQKLKMENGKLTATLDNDLAYFGGEGGEGIPYDINLDASFQEGDVDGLTPEDVVDELFGGECTVYSPKRKDTDV
jgi:hypothetical protein